MAGVFPIHVTLSDSSDDRAVKLYYGEEMIFFSLFFCLFKACIPGFQHIIFE